MRRLIFGLLGGLALTLVMPFVGGERADAVIHEIVAAYCSGGDVGIINEGGELEPAPLLGEFGDPEFPAPDSILAKPVLAGGTVDLDTFSTTDAPQLKLQKNTFLPLAELDHPSADNCKALRAP